MATFSFSSYVFFISLMTSFLLIDSNKLLKDATYVQSYNQYENETIEYIQLLNSSKKIEYKFTETNISSVADVSHLSMSENNVEHPCLRPCNKSKPMTCKYDFVTELYSVMSKACANCPLNKTHCYRKGCIPGDGVKRTILVVNRQMPGPKIDVCYGDEIVVNVSNHMFDISTSIHWHGIRQTRTPFMDGMPFVAQCPIHPQTTFLYRFFADSPGTHIWHSHAAFQRGDGLYGPLVIRVPENENPHSKLYDFDLPQHTFTIMDWEHKFSTSLFSLHMHSAGSNKPSTILVNGKGRFKNFGNEVNASYTPVETFTVKKGFRYRFRLINVGFLNCPIEMSVDNHNITIIASDGGDLQPIETVALVSMAGERYDFIINANQEVKNYWLRFKGSLDCAFKKAYQMAILHYEGADMNYDPEGEVTYETASSKGLLINKVNSPSGHKSEYLLASELSSLPTKEKDPALKPEPDFRFYTAFDFNPLKSPYESTLHKLPGSQRLGTPQINHISMDFPPFPLMINLEMSKKLHFCNGSSISMDCRFNFCKCLHVLKVPLNSVVEVILIDEGQPYNANHPFHLHGYKFRVIGMDRLGNNTTEQRVRMLDEEGLLKRNFENPPSKDTITTPDGGYTIIRFHATNPGYWIFHCHIDFHSEIGMALLFKVGDESTYAVPPKNFPTCGHYTLPSKTKNECQTPLNTNSILSTMADNNKDFYSVYTSSGNHMVFNEFLWFLCYVYLIHLLLKP